MKGLTHVILLPLIGLALLILISACAKEPEPKKEEEEVVENCLDEERLVLLDTGEKKYELVQVLKSWQDASECAVERGGYLAEINDALEQSRINSFVRSNITDVTVLVAFNGGEGSYVWLGGSDLSEEGDWIWDGDNDGEGDQFWEGNLNGSAVNGLYSNWGMEPDNSEDQDALGLAVTDWQRGVAGEWNDLGVGNRLYFVIEYD